MSEGRKICGICSAPDVVRQSIERDIADAISYKNVAKKSGFSKTTVFRHCNRHVARRAVNQFRRDLEFSSDMRNKVAVTVYPDNEDRRSDRPRKTPLTDADYQKLADGVPMSEVVFVEVRFDKIVLYDDDPKEPEPVTGSEPDPTSDPPKD